MYEKLSYMLNTNASNTPSVAQQLQGLSFDDIVAVVEQHKLLITQRDQVIASHSDEIKNKDLKISQLTFEVATLKRLKFGKKSEQLAADQFKLFDDAIMADISEIEQELKVVNGGQASVGEMPKPRKVAFPAEFPRTEIHHELDATCSCGCEMKRIGEDVTEKLDYTPGVFTVEKHIRGKWACAHCKTLTQAPVPAQIIDKGVATPGLLAHVLIAKYADHLPLYRQQQIFERAGQVIPRSSMADWVGQCGAALQPLVEALKGEVLKHSVLHADETPVATLSPGDGKTHRSYIWAYAPGQFEDLKAVVFDFCESRSGEHNRNFLGNWKGSLVTDDYSGYKYLFYSGIEEVGCMAHARRKFFDLYENNKSPMAHQALEFIQQLYEVEREVKDLSAEERWKIRQSRGKPIADAMHQWLLSHRLKISDGSAGAKAMDYSIKRWSALVRYLDNGQLPIDNNLIENTIRPIALGKKNWLFAGSQRAGRRAAAAMSLIQSAKMNGLDPYVYLKDVLERLPTHKNHLIHELLPHNWKPRI